MKIYGIEKLSLVDYDGYTACTLFTSSCNFSCGFCHNSSLVSGDYDTTQIIDEKTIFDYLIKRRSLLDAVVITGGEPTLHYDLPIFIKKIKALGYRIKLDTNGTQPQMILDLIKNHLVDHIAMDIKATPEKYELTVGKKGVDKKTIFDSADILMKSGIEYEFRTTLVKEYHEVSDFETIGNLLHGAKKYYLQKFVDNGGCIVNGLHEINVKTATEIAEILKMHDIDAKLRGY